MGKVGGSRPEKNPNPPPTGASHGAPETDEAIVARILTEHKPSQNPLVRSVWVVLGTLAVVFSVIGLVVPGWPTTSWLVCAAFCYARSSQKLFRWLLTNRLFGPALLDYYRSGKALPFHSKMIICAIICVVSAASIYAVTQAGDPGFGQGTILIVAVIGVWWVGWKVPTAA